MIVEDLLLYDDTAKRTVLLRLLPPIRRAREYRLYAEGNRRFLDLWQYGGRAVMGHNPPGVLRELKNTAERGLFAPLPGHLEGRFIKALSHLFPGRSFRLYPNEAALRRALTAAGFDAAPFPDPALVSGEVSSVREAVSSSETMLSHEALPSPEALALHEALPLSPPLWRPFLDEPIPVVAAAQTATLPDSTTAPAQTAAPPASPGTPPSTEPPSSQDAARSSGVPPFSIPPVPLFIPVLPLPWTGAPWVLVLEPALEPRFPSNSGPSQDSLSHKEILSPVVLAAAARSVYDLIAASDRKTTPGQRIRRALIKSIWQRRGIYLSLRETPDDDAYAAMFRRFLDAGFLLPPGPEEPLILPAVMSPGEEAKLASLLQGPQI
jgi:hypothetical protein